MRVGCFASLVFLVSRECCVALPLGAMRLSAVWDCGISDHTHLLFLCVMCLLGGSCLLCDSSSRCHGFLCSLWLWYFLIIVNY